MHTGNGCAKNNKQKHHLVRFHAFNYILNTMKATHYTANT